MPLDMQSRIDRLRTELKALAEYPVSRLANEIQAFGFACKRCARCCTKASKGHAFLLDGDVATVRRLCPGALVPSPFFEYADQYGRFYTSGYVLRTRADGTCTFLDHVECAIYPGRPAVCRIYPYMLRRESDENGKISWRNYGRPDCQGLFLSPVNEEDAAGIAHDTMRYEQEVIDHELRYLGFIQHYFQMHALEHHRSIYDAGIRQFMQGDCVTVMTYHAGRFEENEVRSYMY